MAVSTETTSEWTLWMVAVSCALHVTEEYLTGWQEWARQHHRTKPSVAGYLHRRVSLSALFVVGLVGRRA
jgi:hypothetical protein